MLSSSFLERETMAITMQKTYVGWKQCKRNIVVKPHRVPSSVQSCMVSWKVPLFEVRRLNANHVPTMPLRNLSTFCAKRVLSNRTPNEVDSIEW